MDERFDLTDDQVGSIECTYDYWNVLISRHEDKLLALHSLFSLDSKNQQKQWREYSATEMYSWQIFGIRKRLQTKCQFQNDQKPDAYFHIDLHNGKLYAWSLYPIRTRMLSIWNWNS